MKHPAEEGLVKTKCRLQILHQHCSIEDYPESLPDTFATLFIPMQIIGHSGLFTQILTFSNVMSDYDRGIG